MGSAAAQALGAYIHHFSADTNRGANSVGDAFSHAIASVPGVIGDNVGGFINGIMSGQAPKTAAPAKGGQAAAKAPAAPAATGPKAPVYTAAQLAAAPNFVQQWNAAHPNDPVGGAISASGGGGGQMTPLDVIRNAAMASGGLSLNQLASLSESVARTVPQATRPVPLTSKEKATDQYTDLVNKYAAAQAQDPSYATSPTGAAHYGLIENLRPVVGPANQMYDISGTPPNPSPQ